MCQRNESLTFIFVIATFLTVIVQCSNTGKAYSVDASGSSHHAGAIRVVASKIFAWSSDDDVALEMTGVILPSLSWIWPRYWAWKDIRVFGSSLAWLGARNVLVNLHK
ncbi:hypothetical protein P153DRAFT_148766 [Dothidotthia symphoricarpi CBS 119687]|uniref:Uncharacterized protein n=1 Tax=Dothidotthia symphoricarpi CBS 119687 TaxID=1392245 RepID=A0A6A5ZXK8_9PLEO|nr:uncharacterized protein P153DRAFT_148766 [Dothidotthia symphoricarpi CBS 119687]KAF2123644.1 hypothetical protein P153DRAFT_148766 [Dothidotthia symphoricarpi CBS 119687]